MANLIIYRIGQDTIVDYIENCKRIGSSFFGTNKKIIQLNLEKFGIKWTYSIVNDLSTPVSEVKEAESFGGEFVGTKEEVKAAKEAELRKVYSVQDEIKILRDKISGDLSVTDWNNYINFVRELDSQASAFINKNKL